MNQPKDGNTLPFLVVALDTCASEYGWTRQHTLHEPVGPTMAMLDAMRLRHGNQLPIKPLGMEEILRNHGIGC